MEHFLIGLLVGVILGFCFGCWSFADYVTRRIKSGRMEIGGKIYKIEEE